MSQWNGLVSRDIDFKTEVGTHESINKISHRS
jgi:hypothetical protein